MYALNNNVTYFDSFGVEHIPREHLSAIKHTRNDSVMCGYFCIRFVEFMIKDKSLTDFTNLFSSNDF